MEKAVEQTLDRSFDQTAEHIHLGSEPCPTCKSFDCIDARRATRVSAAGPDDFGGEDFPSDCQPRATGNQFPEHLRRPFDRHVSPAILEQRILDLEAERDSLRSDCELELSRWTEAEKRIKHFENLVSVLSSYIDKLNVKIAQIQMTANLVSHNLEWHLAGEPEGGQPLPFAVPADETDETRSAA